MRVLPALHLLATPAAAQSTVQDDVFAYRSEQHHLVVGKVLSVTYREPERLEPQILPDGREVLIVSNSCGLETAEFAVEWSSTGLPDQLTLEHRLGEWCTPAFDWKADRMFLVLDASGRVRASTEVIDGIAPLVRFLREDFLDGIEEGLRLPVVTLDPPLLHSRYVVPSYAVGNPLEMAKNWLPDDAVLCRTTYKTFPEGTTATDYRVAFTKGVPLDGLWSGFGKSGKRSGARCDPAGSERETTIEILDPR